MHVAGQRCFAQDADAQGVLAAVPVAAAAAAGAAVAAAELETEHAVLLGVQAVEQAFAMVDVQFEAVVRWQSVHLLQHLIQVNNRCQCHACL